MARIRIGTSGYNYDHWTPALYPAGTPASDRLLRYAAEFGTVEIPGTFAHWPAITQTIAWHRQVPEGLSLNLIAPRALTHGKWLSRPEIWNQKIAGVWHLLGDARGHLVVRLPSEMARDDARLEYFLTKLPDWINVAVEFGHESWLDEEVFALLERHRAAYVVTSGARLPCVLRATSDEVYVRLYGPDNERLYAGSYSDQDLAWWAERVHEWHLLERHVRVIFLNDHDAIAIRDARRFKAILGLTWPDRPGMPD